VTDRPYSRYRANTDVNQSTSNTLAATERLLIRYIVCILRRLDSLNVSRVIMRAKQFLYNERRRMEQVRQSAPSRVHSQVNYALYALLLN